MCLGQAEEAHMESIEIAFDEGGPPRHAAHVAEVDGPKTR